MNKPQLVVLVVDPDTDRATALTLRLDRGGYRAVRRSSGTDALQCIAADTPDLVLSELDLLDLESPELLRATRALSPASQVVFISRQGNGLPLPMELEHRVLRQEIGAGAADEVLQAVDRFLEQSPFREPPCRV